MHTSRPKPAIAPSHRSRRSKHVSPINSKAKRQSVSAASVFKAKPKKPHAAPKTIPSNTRVNGEDVEGQKAKSRSNSRSPQKATLALREERSTPHQLELEFKEITNAYRVHVYNKATTKLTEIHTSLTTFLDTFIGETSSTSQSQNDPTQPKPTITGRVDDITENLRTEFGAHRICTKSTNKAGEEVDYEELLSDKMANYVEHLEKEQEELEKLQGEWELVLGEIWKLGVQALGKDRMSEMLITSSPPAKVDTLGFEQDGNDLASPAVEPKKMKKSVSFVNQAQRPHFLNKPSVLIKRVPSTPSFPANEIGTLEMAINELGAKEVAKLQKAERDYQAHWAKKNAAIAMIFQE